jgi:hypothetical protein
MGDHSALHLEGVEKEDHLEALLPDPALAVFLS